MKIKFTLDEVLDAVLEHNGLTVEEPAHIYVHTMNGPVEFISLTVDTKGVRND